MREEFNKKGWMKYHPDYHHNHRKKMTVEELKYLCKFYGYDHLRSLAFALGRTEATLQVTLENLKKEGKIEYYRRLWDQQFDEVS